MLLHLSRAAFLGLVTVVLASCHAMPQLTVPSEDTVPLDYLPVLSGDYFEFQSGDVGRSFHIYVRLPETYSEAGAAYPAVFLLDGDSLFPILAASHLFLHLLNSGADKGGALCVEVAP